jgi:single-stranded-DNA-specific exonuclease
MAKYINERQRTQIKLSDGTILDPFVQNLLSQRGICGEETIKTFLEPKLKNLPSPFLMKDMGLAVQIIEGALKKNNSILVWGDYDVDGTSATALLVQFFKSIGLSADYYIPNRLTEGYGIQKEGLRRISNNRQTKDTVLITVDNGISAHEAVEFAKELGYKTIVTDHHLPPPVRVAADAVINPSQESCDFPDKTLAGVGVAFYLAMGIRTYLSKKGFFSKSQEAPNLKRLLDLVAVGTVADMVPLEGINRILVRAGMETLAQEGNQGLTALCRKTNLDPGFVRSEDISFQLAPKINAAGRLGQVEKAMNLFFSDSKKDAVAIANDLIKNNEKRKSININDFINAKDEVSKTPSNNNSSIVVAGKYHIGVAGIVASNLVEKYKKPSVVLCDSGDGVLKGSARSVPGVDLHQVLEECQEVLLGFGGHKMAGGMSLDGNNLNIFRQLFDKSVKRQDDGKSTEIEDGIDADIEIKQLFSKGILRQLHLLEPFGQGNPQPIFRDTTSKFSEISPIGKDKNHLRLSFNNGRNKIKGIAFGMGELAEECRTKKDKEILYTPSVNFFKGKRSWQVRVTDITFDGS